jgi:glucose-6-phosphate isomerase
MPFARLPEETLYLDQIKASAEKYQGFDNLLVFGMGGSALGTRSLYEALKKDRGTKRLFVLDTIDVSSLDDLFATLKGQKNLYIFVSKSGNTTEVLAQYLYVKKIHPELPPENFFVITGPKDSFMKNQAEEEGFGFLPIPPGVGGRFSVFSAVGLFPLLLAGINIEMLLEGAKKAEETSHSDILARNPAAILAFCLHHWMTTKKIAQIVMMPYADRLRLFTDWFAQLWAESLGKRLDLSGNEVFCGTTPLKSLGTTDQHSQLQLYLEGPHDKLVGFIRVEDRYGGVLPSEKFGDDRVDFLCGKTLQDVLHAEQVATEEALREAGRPSFTLSLARVDEFQLGQLYQIFMNTIPYLGALFNINPFDQPAVERIKKFTYGLLGRKGFVDFGTKIQDQKKRSDLIF